MLRRKREGDVYEHTHEGLPSSLLPLLSLVLSFPLLLGIPAADALICYEAITGYTRILRSLVDSLQPPWFASLLLYALFST